MYYRLRGGVDRLAQEPLRVDRLGQAGIEQEVVSEDGLLANGVGHPGYVPAVLLPYLQGPANRRRLGDARPENYRKKTYLDFAFIILIFLFVFWIIGTFGCFFATTLFFFFFFFKCHQGYTAYLLLPLLDVFNRGSLLQIGLALYRIKPAGFVNFHHDIL